RVFSAGCLLLGNGIRGSECFGPPTDHSLEQRGLAAEVGIHGHLRPARPAGDLVHASGRVADSAKYIPSRIENGFAFCLAADLSRLASGCHLGLLAVLYGTVHFSASACRRPGRGVHMIRVTPIQTGWARVKSAQKCGRDGRSSFGRKLDIVRDKVWAGPLPVLAWLVEHPEGRFVIDTGDTAENSTPGYLPWWNPFFTRMVEIKVAPVEEIGFRLHTLGIDPARDIAAVILTHYHHDHTGGLHHFPHTRIIGPRDGWQLARSLKGKMMGCLPQRW